MSMSERITNHYAPHYDLLARADIVRGFGQLQRSVDAQQNGMYPDGRTVMDQFDRSGEERRELFHEVVQYDGSDCAKERVGSEIADEIISLLGIATVAAIRVGPHVVRSLSGMRQKYDVGYLAELRAKGLTQEQAVAEAKRAWR